MNQSEEGLTFKVPVTSSSYMQKHLLEVQWRLMIEVDVQKGG